MRTADETRRLVRLRQQLARSELKLARLRKRERANDAHQKFRLGGLAELLGWDELVADELERLVAATREAASDPEALEGFRNAGTTWFERRERIDALEPSPPSSDVTPDHVRVRAHRLITIGGLFVRDGLDALDPATLLGAMLACRPATSTMSAERRKAGRR